MAYMEQQSIPTCGTAYCHAQLAEHAVAKRHLWTAEPTMTPILDSRTPIGANETASKRHENGLALPSPCNRSRSLATKAEYFPKELELAADAICELHISGILL